MSSSLLAFSPLPEEPYNIQVGDKYIFIMTSNDTTEPYLSSAGKEYKFRGLYYNDGSVTPVWTISFYSFDRSIYISDDGVYLVYKSHRWVGYNAYTESMIEFYKNGKLIKKYTVYDLIDSKDKTPYGMSWYKDYKIEDNIVILTTLENNKFVFDISTGDLLSKVSLNEEESTEWELSTYILAIFLLLVISVVVYIFIKKRKK